MADQRYTVSVRITDPTTPTQQAAVDSSNRLTTITAQGAAAAGSGAWPITVTNTSDTVVKPGDAVNNAVRVNIVAGGTASPTSPTVDQATSASLAAGASVSLTSANIAAAVVSKLWGLDLTCSVAFKAVIKEVVNNVTTSLNVLFAEAGTVIQWRPPDRTFYSFTAAGTTNNWTVTFTNMDTSEAADVYAAFMYAQS
jgi:hypothetical protein